MLLEIWMDSKTRIEIILIVSGGANLQTIYARWRRKLAGERGRREKKSDSR